MIKNNKKLFDFLVNYTIVYTLDALHSLDGLHLLDALYSSDALMRMRAQIKESERIYRIISVK